MNINPEIMVVQIHKSLKNNAASAQKKCVSHFISTPFEQYTVFVSRELINFSLVEPLKSMAH